MATHKEIGYPSGQGHRSRRPETLAEQFVIGQPEAEFQATVIEIAKTHGWRVYHTFRSDRSEEGYPDLCMVRDGRLIYAELKKVGKAPTMEQVQWLLDLARVPGVEVYAWDAMDTDAIHRILG